MNKENELVLAAMVALEMTKLPEFADHIGVSLKTVTGWKKTKLSPVGEALMKAIIENKEKDKIIEVLQAKVKTIEDFKVLLKASEIDD